MTDKKKTRCPKCRAKEKDKSKDIYPQHTEYRTQFRCGSICVVNTMHGDKVYPSDKCKLRVWKQRAKKAEKEIERSLHDVKWLKLGHEAADGFLGEPSRAHIVDKVCIIGHERDELKEEVERLQNVVRQLRKQQWLGEDLAMGKAGAEWFAGTERIIKGE